MASNRPGHRWQPRLPGLPRRVVGQRREIPAERPSRGVLWRLQGRRIQLPKIVLSHRARRALVFGGGGAVALVAIWFLYRSPPLSVQGVDVEGANAVPAGVIRDVAAIDDDSVFRPDLDAARERLLALPMVRKARVERDWPLGVDITIVERKPWGVWRAGGQPYVVDDQGFVLDVRPVSGAPLIIQTGTAEKLRPGERVGGFAVPIAAELLATADQTLGRQVIRLQYSAEDGLTLVMTGEAPGATLRVLFGQPQDFEFKVAALYGILRRAAEDGRSVRSVDLRFGQRVAVQWGDAA